MEARKDLARNVDQKKCNIVWADDEWTTVRESGRVRIEGRCLRIGRQSNVIADNSGFIDMLLKLAEEDFEVVTDDSLMFWAEFRFCAV